jgi:hypothetical protein
MNSLFEKERARGFLGKQEKNARVRRCGQLDVDGFIFASPGECSFVFSVKIFLSRAKNKIQIFSCRWSTRFLISSRWQGGEGADVNNM